MFVIEGKVALITGGASGMGLLHAKELLRNGLRGVTLADVNEEFGRKALNEINDEFGGQNRAIFVKTDVSDKNQLEESFKATIATFKNLDILINNAAILNDAIWEKEISININGTVNGILLALNSYLKHRTDSEAVILNIASVTGINGFGSFPIYSATKHAIIGLTRAWGTKPHYERSKVKVLALCPGVTDTCMVQSLEVEEKTLGPLYTIMKDIEFATSQAPEHVAKSMVKIIKEGETGSVWVVEDGEPVYEITIHPRQNLRRQ